MYVGTPMKRDRQRNFTERELDILMDNLKGSKYYNLFLFLVQTGLRIGEVVGKKPVRWRDNIAMMTRMYPGVRGIRPIDIDIERCAIEIEVEKRKLNKYGDRPVELRPVSPDAMTTILKQLDHDSRRLDSDMKVWKISQQRVGQIMAKNKIGLRYSHPHMLRHTFATIMTNNINDPLGLRDVKEMMGHSDIRITEGYLGNRKRSQLLRDVTIYR